VGELDIINNVYLRGIEPLYTWKTLVLECLRSSSYSNTLPNTLGNTLPNILANTLANILANILEKNIE